MERRTNFDKKKKRIYNKIRNSKEGLKDEKQDKL